MQTLKTAIMNSISEVLETMFFMSVECEEQASFDVKTLLADERMLASLLPFSGNGSGSFVLLIPSQLLSELTADFMGLDADEISNVELAGTAKEMINMVAGNAFSKMADAASYQLGIPEFVEEASKRDSLAAAADSVVHLEVNTPHGSFYVVVQTNNG